MSALDYSGARSQRSLFTVAMTIAMITRLMPVHPNRRFGIGAIRIRDTILRYPNARSPGDKLFSSYASPTTVNCDSRMITNIDNLFDDLVGAGEQ